MGKGSVAVECAVRADSLQRHDTSGVRSKDFCTRTHAQNHCAMECHPSLGEGTNPKNKNLTQKQGTLRSLMLRHLESCEFRLGRG